MLRLILAEILEGSFVGPDWMNRYQMVMVHFPEQIPGSPEPPTFSSDSSVEIVSEFQNDEFLA
jgi:hypothetical protein